MAADVARFTEAVDKVYKTFSSQDLPYEQATPGRAASQRLESRFQQQLQRARAAFLQEFRNHSVVVESEVRKIREELVQKLEEKYGEKIAALREQALEASNLVHKHKEEISNLRGLVIAQETYLTAVRHRWGLEQKERLRAELQQLQRELEAARSEKGDLSHQLRCRDELVEELGSELRVLEAELKRQAAAFAEERERLNERIAALLAELRQQQQHFGSHLAAYEATFAEYKAKTAAELQLQDILNSRRCEALALMEEERQRHIKARTKPTPRIGMEQEDPGQPYDLSPVAKYRVDDMGMDTSWREYRLSEEPRGPGGRKALSMQFKIERARRHRSLSGPRAQAPLPTDHATPES